MPRVGRLHVRTAAAESPIRLVRMIGDRTRRPCRLAPALQRILTDMTSKLQDYIAEGRALDADEREIAALALQQVDETKQAEVDAAWEETVSRRLDELKSGKVEAVSGRETIAIARARSAARRG